MPAKRGRPVSGSGGDAAQDRRRPLAAARVRRSRQRQQGTADVSMQPTPRTAPAG